jgi:hypothetical protein
LLSGQKRLSLSGGLACGYCGQHAAYTSMILRRGNVQARPIGLRGHIVVEMISNQNVYLLDPSFDIGPIHYTGDIGDLVSKAAAEYEDLPAPQYKSLAELYHNVDRSVEYLNVDAISDRIRFEERLDRFQSALIGLLFCGGAALALWSAIPRRRLGDCGT